MRLHDMLMTETPQPFMGDSPYTGYAKMSDEAVVIDITDVAHLLMDMTSFSDSTRENFEDFGADAYAWQIAQFFNFEFEALSNCAPPFPVMTFEFDTREAVERHLKEGGTPYRPQDIVHLGKGAVQVIAHPADEFIEAVMASEHKINTKFPDMIAMLKHPDLGWMLYMQPFHYEPGKRLRGPMCGYFIPVKKDGTLYNGNPYDPRQEITLWSVMCPAEDRDEFDVADRLAMRTAASFGWQSITPVLLAISLMHTPQGENGYHQRHENEPPARLAKKYLAKHFRPMTKWYVLDISNLRKAVREASGGTEPKGMQQYLKALHIVRGNYAHYAPNTYFGRTHDEWITVFRPSHKRGDVRSGKVDKDYRVGAE